MERESKQKCQSIVENVFFSLPLFFIASPVHTFQYLQQTDTSNRFLSSHFLSLSVTPWRGRKKGMRDNQYEWMVDGDLGEEGRELEGNESRERASEGRSLHSEGRQW